MTVCLRLGLGLTQPCEQAKEAEVAMQQSKEEAADAAAESDASLKKVSAGAGCREKVNSSLL